MSTEPEVRRALREWIASKSKRTSADELEDTTPLLEKRILTSLQVMDLILYIEQLSGKAIDVQQLRPGTFRNVDSIYRSFFARDGR